MSQCASCKKDFVPLLKNIGLPYKTCDRSRCDDNKYKDTHQEQIKFMIINIENLIKISFKKKQNNILKIIRINYMLKIK